MLGHGTDSGSAHVQVTNDEGRVLALKLHRLGRTSFRNVRVNIVRIVLCRLAATHS